MKAKRQLLAISIVAIVLMGGCAALPAKPAPGPAEAASRGAAPAAQGAKEIPNPAAQNCLAKGGQTKIETRPDGAQFGVCYFTGAEVGNRQCEEWALMRGECPAGGVDVTGYNTEAARYCAITGGQYVAPGDRNISQGQPSCILPGGKICDASAYYEGACTR